MDPSAAGVRLDSAAILRGLVEILEEMTQEWDTGLSGRIGPDTLLIENLTFESIDIVMLIVAIEERFGRKGLPFDQVLMADGQYVEDLRVRDLAAFLERALSDGGDA